jgi:L-histidine N-alpha-methyltransferase
LSFRLELRLDPSELAEQLRREAREGLTKTPKQLRSRWLWDEGGSALYERIMELPEYYLPGAERAILEAHADDIAAAARPRTVVELGSGSSVKTRMLLDALPGLERFVAVDVSESALANAGGRLATRYPHVEVAGIVADYERELPSLAEGTLLVFLGSTIGALEPGDRSALLASIAGALPTDGTLLLGLDLVKPVERIVAAYNDPQGLSAALIANLLPILNRELGADFDPARFGSEARWNPELERMEMVVRSLEAQSVNLPAIDLTVAFAEGETLRTEISTKFSREGVTRELEAAGLAVQAWWTDDEAGDFALCLARPVPERRDAA